MAGRLNTRRSRPVRGSLKSVELRAARRRLDDAPRGVVTNVVPTAGEIS